MTVADTGIGMSQAQIESSLSGVLNPHGWDESPRGAGLGLLIAVKLASLMGGRIVATSEIGRGSKFSLELPMGPNLSAVEREPVSAGRTLHGLRILVVEDEMADGGLLTALLNRLGATTSSFVDGKHVAEAVAAERFALVLLDLHLPALDAIRCTRAIRDLPGGLGLTPVIGLTSALSELDRWACIQSGMTDFVMKSVDQDALAESVLRWALPHRGAAVRLSRPA